MSFQCYDSSMTPTEIQGEFQKGNITIFVFCARFVLSKFVTDEKLCKNLFVEQTGVEEDDWSFSFDKKLKRTKSHIMQQKKKLVWGFALYIVQIFFLVSASCVNFVLRRNKCWKLQLVDEQRTGRAGGESLDPRGHPPTESFVKNWKILVAQTSKAVITLPPFVFTTTNLYLVS